MSATERWPTGDGADGLRHGAASRRPRRSPVRAALRACAVSVVLAPTVGAAWWLLSPGGLRPPGGTYVEVIQARGGIDAAFALVCLVTGALVGLGWVLTREEELGARAAGRLVGLLAGGLLGAGVAWGTGWALDALVPVPQAVVDGVDAADVAALSSPRPSLAALAGAFLWPLAVGVLVVADTARELAVAAWRRGG